MGTSAQKPEVETANGAERGAGVDDELADLLARVGMGDRAAFACLYRAASARIYGLLVRLTGSRDLAGEVMQDVFVQVWNSASAYRPQLGAPGAWLSTIARNRAIDRLRKEDRQRRLFDRDVSIELLQVVATDNPLRETLEGEAGQKLAECLGRLAQNQRHVVWLAYRYGHTRQEIAARLEAPVGTVKSWLHRGLKRLAGCLQR